MIALSTDRTLKIVKGTTFSFALGALVAYLSGYGADLLGHHHPLSFVPFIGVFVFSPGSVIAAAYFGALSTDLSDVLVRVGANGIVYSLVYLGFFALPNSVSIKRVTYTACCLGIWILFLVIHG